MRQKNKKSVTRESFTDTGIYIYGQRELIIDGKCSLILYEDCRIVLQSKKKGFLSVNGSGLKLCTTGNNGICIKGDLRSLEFAEEI